MRQGSDHFVSHFCNVYKYKSIDSSLTFVHDIEARSLSFRVHRGIYAFIFDFKLYPVGVCFRLGSGSSEVEGEGFDALMAHGFGLLNQLSGIKMILDHGNF